MVIALSATSISRIAVAAGKDPAAEDEGIYRGPLPSVDTFGRHVDQTCQRQRVVLLHVMT